MTLIGAFGELFNRSNKSNGNPRILTYHMVSPHLPEKYYSDGQKVKNYLRVTPEEFEKQIVWLKEAGYSFFKMRDVLSADLPEKSVFLTFDDGYADNYGYAFQILKKHNVSATIYLVVNRFDGEWSTDRATGAVSMELNDQPMLSHELVEEMVASDLVEFGGHTFDHVRLNELDDDVAYYQIHDSKQSLEVDYGIEVSSFAYPFGYFSQSSIELVEKAGYSNACTTEDGTDSNRPEACFVLRRIMVSGNDSFRKFVKKVTIGKRK